MRRAMRLRPEDARKDFESLFLKHQQSLRAFVFSAIRDRSGAEDVLQEVATALWTGFARYDTARPFLPWAFGVAANILKQHHGRGARFGQILSPDAIEAIANAASQLTTPLDAQDSEQALRVCMQKLPARSERLLTLRYESNLNLSAIASRAGIGVEGVRKALSRLRQGLRVCVEKRIREGVGQ